MSSDCVRPLVGIPGSIIRLPEHAVPQHGIGERYITAVAHGSGATPFVIPALADAHDFDAIVEHLDGLFLTGGRANVEPYHYNGPPFPDDEIIDPARDNTVLPLIRACVDKGVPVFGVCRGVQELNVALGGTLHYRVHMVDGKMDHRMPKEGDIEHKFGLRHMVQLTEGGLFHGLVGEKEVKVNSLHGQGIDRPADGMVVEATAPDGIVEGIRLNGTNSFAVGVQWHAEWRYEEHNLASALFREFGNAARERAKTRRKRVG